MAFKMSNIGFAAALAATSACSSMSSMITGSPSVAKGVVVDHDRFKGTTTRKLEARHVPMVNGPWTEIDYSVFLFEDSGRYSLMISRNGKGWSWLSWDVGEAIVLLDGKRHTLTGHSGRVNSSVLSGGRVLEIVHYDVDPQFLTALMSAEKAEIQIGGIAEYEMDDIQEKLRAHAAAMGLSPSEPPIAQATEQ